MITTRQEALLASIIKEYIETAEPVSSKILEKSGFFDLSSASIRGEMNDLEGAGFLMHLYTSSGRIPTDKAYRYFVDNHVNHRSTEEAEFTELRTKDKIKIRSAV